MPLTPFDLEIYQNVLSSIAEEMGELLIRAGFSPNIKERRDLSCAVFDRKGDMIAQAAHIPIHLGSMSFAVKAILKEPDIEPGDVFILNDPFRGGTHLPDITCIKPVFWKGQLSFFVASRAHHADIGGITPGSMPISTTVEEEGILIPPSKLYKKNRLNKKLFNMILNKTRDPEEREGDFNAQVGAITLGEKRLHETIAKYGIAEITEAGIELLRYSEKIMKEVIGALPQGVYSFKDFMDDDGAGTRNIPINVKITIKGKSAIVDFRGSSPAVKGNLNAPYSVTTAAALYVFQCLAPKELPLNSGPLRAIKILVDDDSILNAKFPSAVVGGNVETSQRVVDAVFGALAKAAPGRVPAASAGSMSNITFGGVNPRTGHTYAYYETIAGGMGARPGLDGVSAVQTHMTNTLNTPVEAIERELPVMIGSYTIRRRSGGSGKYRGGDAITREFKFLQKATLSLITERRRYSPYGLNGGEPGKRGKNIIKSRGTLKALQPKCTLQVKKGDIIRIDTPAGGGLGRKNLQKGT